MKRILPAYPIFVKDPNFSIWHSSDLLNEKNVSTWFGEEKEIYGFLKTHGKTYCFMGNNPGFSALGVEMAEQTDLKLTSFTTEYSFSVPEGSFKVIFTSPVLPTDLSLMSLPVCYMSYQLFGIDEGEVSLFVGGDICYNKSPLNNIDKTLSGGVLPLSGFEAAFFGLMRQLPLSNTKDRIGADWGYFYLGAEECALMNGDMLSAYLTGADHGFISSPDSNVHWQDELPEKPEMLYLAAYSRAKCGKILIGYDERASIDYFGDIRQGYYLEDHTITEALEYIYENSQKVDKLLSDFDRELTARAMEYGEDYRDIIYASLRQSITAHKLIKDRHGNVLFLSKENGSNGCIGTVDVSYPSIPLYLLYNPELVKGMMRPILKFARMPVWSYDFAPHDVGTYPVCSGQKYSLIAKEGDKKHGNLYLTHDTPRIRTNYPVYLFPKGFDAYRYDGQMPVEECANMLIMFLAVYTYTGDKSFFEENLDLCEKWSQYLVKFGLKPENQLCTDDFAGHLANNVNLAIKATVGIASYAKLLSTIDKTDAANKYQAIAKSFASEIKAFAEGKRHLPLTWDSDDATFSLKYNFAFDKILGLGLFDRDLLENEVSEYIRLSLEYGTPLDNRKPYTKSDWLVWSASLSDSNEKRRAMIAPIAKFLRESPDRIPFGDWYFTDTALYRHFVARSVQGGCFILLL